MTGLTDLVPGTLVYDRYRLDAELGRGGMGVLYRAYDTLLNREVAIKALLAATLSAESRARLLREAQAAARLHHPNIVSVYDIVEADRVKSGIPFIVMERVDGESLHSRRPQTLTEILSITRQVCVALAHAHAHGIVHRDLKPENVLIARDGSVRLVDFGLAQVAAQLASARSEAGEAIVGTVFYLAPEQALGQEVDGRADLYALGVMLYELATGQLPHTGDDPLVVISKHLHAPVVPPSTLNADIPPALDVLIVQLLGKQPQDRPASAAVVRQALDDLLAAMQPPAPADSLQPQSETAPTPFLQTKLYIPPARPKRVSRPHLLERLDVGLRRKLTLVSAPAGFGKTTLISEWVASHRRGGPRLDGRVAWLSLDESDNDPARFLTYLVAALQTVEANIGQGALNALHAPQPPPPQAIMTTLINELAALPGRVVLVLDDYHLIEGADPASAPIHDALDFFLQHMPPQMHLAIATRDDPPLPLARLRARGQLTELRAADLRFTASEAAEFLNTVMGLDLAAEDVAALEGRTEGWIAGLQLAALSMQGRQDVAGFVQSFTGSHRFVLDYLVEEVLHQQPESAQAFLQQTAILDRLTGPLCNALTGQQDGQMTLERLERANLFIVPLDGERRWYRYHHLFADLLRQRLRQAQPEQVPTLHIRASEWYEQNGFADEAIEHALQAEDFARAASLIEQGADAIWMRGEHAKLLGWLNKLPPQTLVAKPSLCIFAAWHLFAVGQRDEADQVLQAAERVAQRADAERAAELGDAPDPDGVKLRGRLAAIRALMVSWWRDVPRIVQHARRALQDLPQGDPWRGPAAIALGDAYEFQGDLRAAYQARSEAAEACKAAGDIVFCMVANLKVAITLEALGRLQQSAEVCRRQIQLADEHGLAQSSLAGSFWAQWGAVLVEWNNLDGALERAKKGVELTEVGDLALRGFSNLCLVHVLCARGDLDGADKVLTKLETLAQEHDLPLTTTNPTAVWRAILWLMQGKLEQAARWAREHGLDAEAEPPLEPQDEYVLLTRICLAQGALDQAARLAQHLRDQAEAGEHVSSLVEILALQALVLLAQGESTLALAALEKALALAEPGGFVHIFVGAGPPMAGLLYQALGQGIMPDYVRRLLAAFPDAEPEQIAPSLTQAPNQGLIEPLSERELEVLQLIAEGLTNPEIADRLYLSLNTVKVHTRNIYGKLGAHSRTQAVAQGRALGILSSSP